MNAEKNTEKSVPSLAWRINKQWVGKLVHVYLSQIFGLMILAAILVFAMLELEGDEKNGVWLDNQPEMEFLEWSQISNPIIWSENNIDYKIGKIFQGDAQKIKAYKIVLISNETGKYKVFDLGYYIYFLMMFLLIVMSLQIVGIIRQLIFGTRKATQILRPIAMLTKTAEVKKEIDFKPNVYSDVIASKQEVRKNSVTISGDMTNDLTGTLESINEHKLDKRIALEKCPKELQNLAITINDMLDRLESAYEQQVRFVSDASHELRTPLSVIQGYANLINRWGKEDEKTLTESVSAIVEEAEHMKILVENLLFLARGDKRNLIFKPEVLEGETLLKDCYQDAMIIDNLHTWRIVADENIKVFADLHLLKQALWVIIENAIKYTPEKGTITLRLKAVDGLAVFTIQDDGIGMSEVELNHMFDRFYRADNSRTHKTFGYGLGLSIYKMIVDAHNASTEVVSRPSLGTKFSIRIPVVEQSKIIENCKLVC